jgi:hypothetical protein
VCDHVNGLYVERAPSAVDGGYRCKVDVERPERLEADAHEPAEQRPEHEVMADDRDIRIIVACQAGHERCQASVNFLKAFAPGHAGAQRTGAAPGFEELWVLFANLGKRNAFGRTDIHLEKLIAAHGFDTEGLRCHVCQQGRSLQRARENSPNLHLSQPVRREFRLALTQIGQGSVCPAQAEMVAVVGRLPMPDKMHLHKYRPRRRHALLAGESSASTIPVRR